MSQSISQLVRSIETVHEYAIDAKLDGNDQKFRHNMLVWKELIAELDQAIVKNL